jgi:non-ribosomal peptide synthetase-like protein
MYNTFLTPHIFKFLGAKIGSDVEVSHVKGHDLEFLELQDGTFLGDYVLAETSFVEYGNLHHGNIKVCSKSFIGNNGTILSGTTVQSNALIGVYTVSPKEVKNGEIWFGAPPICVPSYERVQNFPEHLTYKPSFSRKLARGVVDWVGMVLPDAVYATSYLFIFFELHDAFSEGNWTLFFKLSVFSGISFSILCYLIVLILKWLLMCRYAPGNSPMHTPFVWLTSLVTTLYENMAVLHFLNDLRGTPILVFCLKLLGVKFGKGVFLATNSITEFDLIEIGDFSEVQSIDLQTHLFEDRVLKMGKIKIGNFVSLQPHSVVLYNTHVHDNTVLHMNSLVMKGEEIPENTAWHGNPATPFVGKAYHSKNVEDDGLEINENEISIPLLI